MEFETNFGYICPDCFSVCSSRLNIFRLSGGKAYRFSCVSKGCRSECAVIKKLGRDQYYIEVNCPLCGEKHSIKLSTASIWQRPYGTIRCPHAAADVFFFGNDMDTLKKHISKTIAIFDEHLSSMDEYVQTLYKEPVVSEFLMNLERMMNDNQISCICGSENITFEFDGKNILLVCRRCGRRKELAISKDNLIRLINASGIVLGS